MINWLHSIDLTVVQALFNMRTIAGSDFFIWVSEFGRPYTIGACTVILILYFYLKKQYVPIKALALSVVGTGLTVVCIKQLLQTPRPSLAYAAYAEIGYGFPSGHTAGAIA